MADEKTSAKSGYRSTSEEFQAEQMTVFAKTAGYRANIREVVSESLISFSNFPTVTFYEIFLRWEEQGEDRRTGRGSRYLYERGDIFIIILESGTKYFFGYIYGPVMARLSYVTPAGRGNKILRASLPRSNRDSGQFYEYLKKVIRNNGKNAAARCKRRSQFIYLSATTKKIGPRLFVSV